MTKCSLSSREAGTSADTSEGVAGEASGATQDTTRALSVEATADLHTGAVKENLVTSVRERRSSPGRTARRQPNILLITSLSQLPKRSRRQSQLQRNQQLPQPLRRKHQQQQLQKNPQLLIRLLPKESLRPNDTLAAASRVKIAKMKSLDVEI
jgi:hypothetical protein